MNGIAFDDWPTAIEHMQQQTRRAPYYRSFDKALQAAQMAHEWHLPCPSPLYVSRLRAMANSISVAISRHQRSEAERLLSQVEVMTGRELAQQLDRSSMVFDVREIPIDPQRDLAVEIGTCPRCNGLIGVDASYLDQVNSEVACPMCGKRVRFPNP